MNLFYGQIRSTVKCRVCQQESATYEGFSNLSLELPQSTRQCDLEECLNMYFHGEVVNGWDCPKCKVKRDAIKKLDISKVPPFLVIHFKRLIFFWLLNEITKQYFLNVFFYQFSDFMLIWTHLRMYIRKSKIISDFQFIILTSTIM